MATPLDFLENILFYDGIKKVESEFLDNQMLLSNGYIFIEEQDYYVKMRMTVDSTNPLCETIVITREIFLQDYLQNQKKAITESLKQHQKENNFTDILSDTYNQLNSFFNKATIIKGYHKEAIEEYIVNLIRDFKIQFPELDYHKAFRVLNDTEGYISYFQYKELKASFFEELYEASFMLNLIDDVEVKEEDFYNTFTFIKPNPDVKITFRVSNHLVAFFLKEIEPFFNNLNSVTIEKSKSFYNKQGKPLTSADLYAALSRNKDKNTESLKKIKSVVEDLKKKYLK